MADAIKYVNGHGKVRFQPERSDGRREWKAGDGRVIWSRNYPFRKLFTKLFGYSEVVPVLYTVRQHAIDAAIASERDKMWDDKEEFREYI